VNKEIPAAGPIASVGHYLLHGAPPERLLTVVVAATGFRIGEVLGPRWHNVDAARSLIQALHGYVRGKIGPPKSAASKKPVVL